MNYHHFTTLEELERADAAWKKGVLLCKRTEGFHTLWLYALDDFYIEATYHTHFNVLLEVTSFTDTDLLEPYLNELEIGSLLA